MIEHQDDINIDKNLNILCKSKNPYDFNLNNFIDSKGKRIHLKHKNEEFASLMERTGLIRVNGFKCSVEKFGLEIFNSGGWIKYLSEQEKGKTKLVLKTQEKESLDRDIKLLQKDKLEHEQTIREQNDRIRNLTEDLKLISLIQKYWWIIATCIGIGWALGEVLNKLRLT